MDEVEEEEQEMEEEEGMEVVEEEVEVEEKEEEETVRRKSRRKPQPVCDRWRSHRVVRNVDGELVRIEQGTADAMGGRK